MFLDIKILLQRCYHKYHKYQIFIIGKFEGLFYTIRNFKRIREWYFFIEYSKKYGDTFVVWLGRRPILMTSNADYVKKVTYVKICVTIVLHL